MTEILVSKQVLECLKKDYGSHFSATETPGGYLVKVNDPEVQRELEMASKIMDEYKETLRILAN
jgi:hypothetical protein